MQNQAPELGDVVVSDDSLTTGMTPPAADEQAYLQYRSLSLPAVASFGLAILSIPAIILPWLLVIPLLGIVLGVVAINSIRGRGHELAGLGLAWIGLILNIAIFVAGAGRASYEYATELPEGFRRTNWGELQPIAERPDLPVPPNALDLDGQQVFIKGYIYPDERGAQLKQFVMVPDLGTCCFGGQPKLTDMMEITLADPLRTQYSRRKHKLGGILRVDTRKKPISGLDGVYYRLDANYMDGKYADE